jgi:hypothetical protein
MPDLVTPPEPLMMPEYTDDPEVGFIVNRALPSRIELLPLIDATV